MKISKYIAEFNATGICVLNEDYVCKNWSNDFALLWSNIQGNEYFAFCIFSNKTALLKVRISKEQARRVVERMNLLFIQDTLLRNAGNYRTREFIESEEKRMSEIIAERQNEIAVLKSAESALYNAQKRPI